MDRGVVACGWSRVGDAKRALIKKYLDYKGDAALTKREIWVNT